MSTVISRREFIRRTAAVGAGGLVLSNQAMEVRVGGKRPNIVLIMADDQGYECLSCYGSASYKTPVLDELAGTGMRFEHCYSQPLCTPTRVQIMTGRYNFRNYLRFGYFDYRERTFAHVLKDAGYATCVAGKWQLIGAGADGPYKAGFDEYCLWHMEDVFAPKDSRYRNPKIIQNGKLLGILEGKYGPDVFCDYINGFIERKKAGPFLVYYPMALTHNPFEPTPDSPEWGQSVSNKRFYVDMVEYMDKTIGRIVRKLDDLGLRENTLILFTGDNGTPVGIASRMLDGGTINGGKGSTTDAGTHAALIANWKGTIPAGKVRADLVDFSDILPTLAEVSGAPLPEGVTIDGRSFLPQLRGRKGNPRDWIFCWYQRDPGDQLHRFARDRRWKLYDQSNAARAGKLFDVEVDRLEQNPIEPGQGGNEAAQARTRLQAVLDSMK